MADALDQILTLVLEKKSPEGLSALMEAFGLTQIRTLSDGIAAEGIAPQSLTPSQISAALSTAPVKVDYCLQANKGRKKSLLICDMDSTLIGQECIDELADFAGFKAQVSEITERAMRGEIGFEGALTDRVALLANLPLSTLQKCFDERIHVNAGAKTLCATMKANGAETVVVSGGFTFFSERVAKAIGFENHHANVLLDDSKALTGKVQMPILGREAKLERLNEYSQDLGGPQTAVAIGDGANDLAMVTASGLGIAYYAKPAVAAAAHCAINHTDLRTALFFQGYTESEFVERG
jgi:phosphoserine phosphatase